MARRLSNAALDVLKDFAPATPRVGRRMSLRNFYMVDIMNYFSFFVVIIAIIVFLYY